MNSSILWAGCFSLSYGLSDSNFFLSLASYLVNTICQDLFLGSLGINRLKVMLPLHIVCFSKTYFIQDTGKQMSCLMTKPTKWLCALRRLRSAWASAQSDQSLRCADAQADPSLRWAHMPFCWFCHEAVQITHKPFFCCILVDTCIALNFSRILCHWHHIQLYHLYDMTLVRFP